MKINNLYFEAENISDGNEKFDCIVDKRNETEINYRETEIRLKLSNPHEVIAEQQRLPEKRDSKVL